MRAFILAAGRGERMRPLTDTCPKPMLKVANTPLLQYHITALQQAGIIDVVINHAWLGEQIVDYFATHDVSPTSVHFSDESSGALETAGGIVKALPLLTQGDENTPFLVVNGDIFTDFDFYPTTQISIDYDQHSAHLYLVENPAHNPKGDFVITDSGELCNREEVSPGRSYTFSGIGVYHPKLFLHHVKAFSALGPLLKEQIALGRITASVLDCSWVDVGTVERLTALDNQVASNLLKEGK